MMKPTGKGRKESVMQWITYEEVAELEPCSEQLELFEKWMRSRKKVAVTAKNLQSAVKAGLDVLWLLNKAAAKFRGNEMRQLFCGSAKWAYCYACDVDKDSRDDTRQAAIVEPTWAYCYARDIDKGPRDDTRQAVMVDPYWAYRYALGVDKCPRNDTRQAAGKDPYYTKLYNIWEKSIDNLK